MYSVSYIINRLTHNYPIEIAEHLNNNAILFHNLIDNIVPTINNCFFSLKKQLDASVQISNRIHKNGKITKRYRKFCTNSLSSVSDINNILNNTLNLVNETILSFEPIDSIYLPTIRIIDDLYEEYDYIKIFSTWSGIINNKFNLHKICELVHLYNKELINILNSSRKRKIRIYRIPKYKIYSICRIKNEKNLISTLTEYSFSLEHVRHVAKHFAILSAARYKDIKDNTNGINISNYLSFKSRMLRILDYPKNDMILHELEELNGVLVYYWKLYIITIRDQTKCQSIMNKDIKKIQKINKKCKLQCNNCNNCTSCNLHVKYKQKLNVFNIVFQQIFVESINNILIKMNTTLKKSANLTRKCGRNHNEYTRVKNNYENFIKDILS